jgi:YVTN family beta-propeller protein
MASSRKRLRTLLASGGTVVALVGIVAVGTARSNAASVPAKALAQPMRNVMVVGNSEAGTVSFLDGANFANLGSVNVTPDLAERLAGMTPLERAGYEIVRAQKGGDRFVDDVAVSPDGRTLYVSRSNLADTIAFDLTTHQIRWRFKVEGLHSDHIGLSPDGQRLVVSATTGAKAHVLDTATGRQVTTFGTGTYPHANDYSADGKLIYNSSIGFTSMPKALEFLKGDRQLTVVDATTFKTVRTYKFDHGVRPAVFMPDGKTMYTQLSYLNGFVEFDLEKGQITRTVELPYSEAGRALQPDQYPQNSAHHGLAVSGDGPKICAAGTIDDYVAIVSRPGLTTDRIIPGFHLPYWANTSHDGKYCLVSNSKDNTVSVISYDTAQEVNRINVGRYPQRERNVAVPPEVVDALSPSAG